MSKIWYTASPFSKQTADVGGLGANSGVREDGCRAWVGWGGEHSRGEYGVSCQGEYQSDHSKFTTDQVRLDRDAILFDCVVDTANVLIRWLPDNAINVFLGETLHNVF